MPQFIIKLVFTLLFSFVLLQPVYAVKIVRLELEYGSGLIAAGGFDIPKTNKTLDMELYDDVAPITVANYLNYVNSGRYQRTFINRSASDFVLQTGGISKLAGTEGDPLAPTLFERVPDFGQIENEFQLSNIRGTIAMARLSGQVNSATSEWFINLKDSNASLDTVDEGFTVFGSLIDDGIEIADQVSAFPIINAGLFFGQIGQFFTELPVADADPNSGEILVQNNLVMVLSATEINRPIVRFSPSKADFGFESAGTVAGSVLDIVLKNTGNEALDINAINTAVLDIPFTIETEDCSNTSLDPVSVNSTSSCKISFKFLPESTGSFSGNLVINYTSQVTGDSFSVKYPLIGEGSLGPPSILTVDSFDVGSSEVGGFSSTKVLTISNNGQASLQVSAITGLDLTSFSQTNDCIGVLIAPSENCAVSITYTASNFGMNSATLSIVSNDPINNFFNISVTGIGESDADGIATAIEDAAPNSGDNNFDGDLDSVQNHVASFVGNIGGYISLVADSGNVVSNVSTIPSSQLVDLPSDVSFKNGAFKFQINIQQPGATIRVGLILPPTTIALSSFYFFGETEDISTPHWYKYDSVQVLTNAPISDPQGNKSVRDLVTLFVQDGGLGDVDKTVNGRITLNIGAPAYSDKSSDSGSVNVLFLLLLIGILITIKRKRYSY
jgi:peptidyl-prolyl cis-trans isomerase A (cyclophilin A)